MFRNRLIIALCVTLLLGSATFPAKARAGIYDDGTPSAPVPGLSTPDGSQFFAFPAQPNMPASRPNPNGPKPIASGFGQPPVISSATLSGDDRDNSAPVVWSVYAHQTATDVVNTATNNNLRVVDLYVESTTSPSQLTAVYVANSGSYAKTWWLLVNVTPATLLAFATTNNARIVVLKAFNDPAPGGDVLNYAVLISNTGADAKNWYFYNGKTVAEVTALWQANNARLVQVNSYVKGSTTLYDVVMISNTGNDARTWWWYVNATMADIGTHISSNNARLVDLDIDPTTGNYNAIMNSCSSGCPTWWWYVGVSTATLLATVTSNGARIIDANSTVGCGDRCWSIVLINNFDVTHPLVASSVRANSDPTSAASVNFAVTFSETVTGVDVSNFSLTTPGVTGASVTGVSGSGATYTVNVNTGSGSGTIRLDVPAGATITDLAGNPLASLPYTSGQFYIIDKTYRLYLPLVTR